MASPTQHTRPGNTAAWVAGFGVYIAFLAADKYIPLPQPYPYVVRLLATIATLLAVSRGVIDWKPRHAAASIGVGFVVFALWVAPDLIPGYRQHWLFSNSLLGSVQTQPPDWLRSHWWLRAAGSTLVVPIVEELFWRGWLMRWLIDNNVSRVALGQYAAGAFWITAALFASEHGPYWEVGLMAGALYGWWMVRTRSVADCILAHAVTNGVLAAYVVATNNWQFWL